MGEIFALTTALCFALSSLLIKRGQASRPNDNGLFMTTLVNLGMYAVLTLGQFAVGQLPPLTWAAVAFFVMAGFTNTFFGRWAWFQSMRSIGPSRATSLKVTNPAFAAVLAFFVLGQPLGVATFVGIGVVLAGVFMVNQEVGSRLGQGTGNSPAVSSAAMTRGVAIGLLSAMSYGVGAVLRALGLAGIPSPFFGALAGSGLAVGSVLLSDVARGNVRRRWAENVRDVPLPFVLAGILSGIGQITQFASLQYTTVAISTTIGSIEPMFTAILSVLFFRQLDTITVRSALAIAGIIGGIAIVRLF